MQTALENITLLLIIVLLLTEIVRRAVRVRTGRKTVKVHHSFKEAEMFELTDPIDGKKKTYVLTEEKPATVPEIMEQIEQSKPESLTEL